MRIVIFIILSNVLFAQSIPEPKIVNVSPPEIIDEDLLYEAEIDNAMAPFLETAKYGLGIVDFNATGDEFATGASFKIFNPSKKTIKYVWFTIAGKNPVGDLVKAGSSYYKTLKAIGPVKPYNFGQWSFDYVWLTNIVETIKITTIKVQYMDLTTKIINYSDKIYIGEDAYDNLLLKYNKKKTLEIKKETRHISPDDQNVFTEVDQTAEFPGGVGSFRSKISSNFDGSAMNGDEGTVRAELTFVVEKDGSITDIKASGGNTGFNNEAVRVISSINTRWTPAKINGQAVRYRFRLPLTMNFEK